MLHGTLQTESGGRVSGRLIYWKMHNELMQALSLIHILPELKSSNFNLRSFGERVALNMPIQGTAADIMKLAMVAVRKRLRQELPEARLVLQVHDELIVECPEAQAETAAALLKEEMENVVSLSVPLTADAHWGRNWLEAKG